MAIYFFYLLLLYTVAGGHEITGWKDKDGIMIQAGCKPGPPMSITAQHVGAPRPKGHCNDLRQTGNYL